MNSWIKFTREEVLTRVEYSETSPSGLVWAENHGGIRGKIYKKGEQAGRMSGRGYQIGIFGVTFMCNRVVYWLLNPDEDLDNHFVHNIDGNKDNNAIENLNRVSVSEFRRLVINKQRDENGLPPSQFLDKLALGKKYREENKEKISSKIKEWHVRNKEYVQVKHFEFNNQNKERKMWQSAKERSIRFNVPFEIEPSDIVIPPFCPILGIPLFRGNGKVHANSPSLDRIVPDLGYTTDNIWVISHKANTMKTNATEDELIVFALWVMETHCDN